MDEKIVLKKIGKRIQKLRKQKGYTQLTFSEIVSLSNNYISQIESGTRSPRLDKLALIINALECSADDVFMDVIDCGYKVKASRLSEKMDGLSEEQREKVFAVIDVLTDENI